METPNLATILSGATAIGVAYRIIENRWTKKDAKEERAAQKEVTDGIAADLAEHRGLVSDKLGEIGKDIVSIKLTNVKVLTEVEATNGSVKDHEVRIRAIESRPSKRVAKAR